MGAAGRMTAMVMVVLVALMVRGASSTCSMSDVQITQDFASNIVTSIIRFDVVNNCGCETLSVVADCSDPRWQQRLVNPFGLLLNSPSPGLCTVLPGVHLQPASQGLRYGRTYTSPDILPLPLHGVTFAAPCSAT